MVYSICNAKIPLFSSGKESKKMDFTLWNYGGVDGYYGTPEGLVAEWKELGFTIGFTHRCGDSPSDREFVRKVLDCCEKEGLKCIIYDARVEVGYLYRYGLEKYREGVAAAEKDFGRHPAAYAWYVGDEPEKADAEKYASAIEAVLELSTPLPYINFNAVSWYSANFAHYGRHFGGYGTPEGLYAATGEFCAPLEMLAFDAYSQETYDLDRNERELGVSHYMHNLVSFGEMARKLGKKFWVSLLAVGHWCYHTPTKAEIRWQIHTAFALGADCVQWFYIYQFRYAYEYFDYAVTIDGRKEPLYYAIADATRTFKEIVEKPLDGYRFDRAWSVGKATAGLPPFDKAEEPRVSIDCYHFMPGILSRFVSKDGKYKYMITNIDLADPEAFGLMIDGVMAKRVWLPSGGAMVFSPEEFK